MWTLLSAGSNAQGQLGIGSIDDSHVFQACSFSGALSGALPLNTNDVVDVANGANHTLVLLELEMPDGSKVMEIWGCGDGKKGQLGPMYSRSSHEEHNSFFQKLPFDSRLDALGLDGYGVKAIGAAWETSYAVISKSKKPDVIVSFGSNDFGNLGIGKDAEDQVVENGRINIVNFSHVSVDGKVIKFADSVTVEKLRTSQRHIIASLNVVWGDQEPVQILIGWGACRHGQLGDPPVLNPSKKPPIPSKKEKTPLVSPQLTYYSRPVLVWASGMPSTQDLIINYSLGIHHSVFLHASGRLSVKGSNRKNQVEGLGNLQNIRDIKCTWSGTYMLTTDETPKVLSTGSNSHGQLGRPDGSHSLQVVGVSVVRTKVKALACGSEHSLVCLFIDEKGDEVWGWGWNEHGNLGLGNTIDSTIPRRIWPPLNENSVGHHVRNIWGGNGSSWILCKKPDNVDGRLT